MKYNNILYIFVSFYAVSFVSGYRCNLVTEKERFCYNDYAMIAKVIDSGRKEGDEIVYRISQIECLKHVGNSFIIRDKVYTSAHTSGMCGMRLQKNSKYILSGKHVDDGNRNLKQYLGLCQISRKLTESVFKVPKC